MRALRKRIERGTLRAARGGGGWRIPRSELERAGLHIAAPAAAAELVAELAETIRRQERELAALRLPSGSSTAARTVTPRARRAASDAT